MFDNYPRAPSCTPGDGNVSGTLLGHVDNSWLIARCWIRAAMHFYAPGGDDSLIELAALGDEHDDGRFVGSELDDCVARRTPIGAFSKSFHGFGPSTGEKAMFQGLVALL